MAVVLVGNASAQVVVGRTQVDGQNVVIYEDFTWEFETTRTDDCTPLGRAIAFCGNPSIWKYTDPMDNEAAAMYRYDDRHYGIIIVEDLGSEDGLTEKFMRQTVIQNAADVAGIPATLVTIYESGENDAAEGHVSPLIYGIKLDGMPVVYANTIVNQPHNTYQLITFSVDDSYSDRHRSLHKDFVNNTQID